MSGGWNIKFQFKTMILFIFWLNTEYDILVLWVFIFENVLFSLTVKILHYICTTFSHSQYRLTYIRSKLTVCVKVFEIKYLFAYFFIYIKSKFQTMDKAPFFFLPMTHRRRREMPLRIRIGLEKTNISPMNYE